MFGRFFSRKAILLLVGASVLASSLQSIRALGVFQTNFVVGSQNDSERAHIIETPYDSQLKSYYCVCASLEMVFDYWGPDVSQYEIANVMWTNAKFGGTSFQAIERGAHFSNVSTSLGGDEPSHNVTGYTTRSLGYAGFVTSGLTLDDLKTLIDLNYPIIIDTANDHYRHARVVVGYNDTAQEIIIHDPIYGPYQHYSYSDFMNNMWYPNWFSPGGWAAFVAPWNVSLIASPEISVGSNFTINATINYLAPEPFAANLEHPTTSTNATINLPHGISLAPTEDYTKTLLNGTFFPRNSTTVSWHLIANNYTGKDTISVTAQGTVSGICNTGWAGYVPYTDRIGGVATFYLDKVPPETTQDYDGKWHRQNLNITLTATDNGSGIAETYYRINNGPTETVSVDGQPTITTEGANNTLEYWSVDNAGNEELPHKILNGIKLDKTSPVIWTQTRTPSSTVIANQPVTISANVTDALSGVKSVRLEYNVSNSALSWDFPMNLNSTTGLYEYTISGQPAGALVKYKITSYDYAENIKVDDNAGQYYEYTVTIPEFPLFLILPLFMITTFLVVLIYRRKRS